MNDVLQQVLADLTAEGDRLDALVRDLDDAGWRTPTPAPGWDVATQVAHLLWTDEVALKAATDKEAWDAVVLGAIDDPEGFVDTEAARLAGELNPGDELLERWRAGRTALRDALTAYPHGEKMPWFGPPMSAASMATARLMETWAHSLDVHEGLGAPVEDTDRIRHIAHLGVRTRNYAFSVHGLDAPADEFRIDLVSPSGDVWSWGPEDATQTLTGTAGDFCRLATQRVHRDDTDLVATGADAEHWLTIAQAFAGPPGAGRSQR